MKNINYFNSEIQKYSYQLSNLEELKHCIQVEEQIRGAQLDNERVMNESQEELPLYHIFDQKLASHRYIACILTSFESCSTCRDQTLKIWKDLYQQNSHLPILLLFTEERALNDSDIRKVKAYLQGMETKIPFFLDIHSMFLTKLGILPRQTPVSLIINGDKKIIAVNRSSEGTLNRAKKFSEFFKNVGGAHNRFSVSLITHFRVFISKVCFFCKLS